MVLWLLASLLLVQDPCPFDFSQPLPPVTASRLRQLASLDTEVSKRLLATRPELALCYVVPDFCPDPAALAGLHQATFAEVYGECAQAQRLRRPLPPFCQALCRETGAWSRVGRAQETP